MAGVGWGIKKAPPPHAIIPCYFCTATPRLLLAVARLGGCPPHDRPVCDFVMQCKHTMFALWQRLYEWAAGVTCKVRGPP